MDIRVVVSCKYKRLYRMAMTGCFETAKSSRAKIEKSHDTTHRNQTVSGKGIPIRYLALRGN